MTDSSTTRRWGLAVVLLAAAGTFARTTGTLSNAP